MPPDSGDDNAPPVARRGAGEARTEGLHLDDSASAGPAHALLARWKLLLQAARDHRLSRTHVAALGSVLDRMDKRTGIAWPAFETIAADACTARSSAAEAIARLCEFGYLVRAKSDGMRSNTYSMGDPTSPESRTVRRSNSPKARTGNSPESRTVDSPELRTAAVRELGLEPVRDSGPYLASLNLLHEPEKDGALSRDGEHPIWGTALRWLMESGKAEGAARAILGKALKQFGDDVALRECVDAGKRQHVVDPSTWLIAAGNARAKTRAAGGLVPRSTLSEDQMLAAMGAGT